MCPKETSRRRGAGRHIRETYQASERHACPLLGQWRGTQRYEVIYRTDEDALTRATIALTSEHGRDGYRRITIESREAGWQVGKDRAQRIWRREGLKAPQNQRPRRRLWLNDGSCVRLRPERANHVELRLREGHDPRWKDAAAIRAARRIHARMSGNPSQETVGESRGDRDLGGRDAVARNPGVHSFGTEFVAQELRKWLVKVGTGTL